MVTQILPTLATRVLALDRVPKQLVLSVSEQEELIGSVFSRIDPPFTLPRYQRLELLEAIERSNPKVAERVYEHLAELLNEKEDLESSNCVGMFTIPAAVCLFHVPSSPGSFVQAGSTGFVTWEAAKCLAWYLWEGNFLWEDILELGCGSGVTGILGVLSGRVSRYVFSDYHESTLAQARENCVLNEIDMTKVEFRLLNFLHPCTKPVSYSTIVAADILYDESLCEGLVRYLAAVEFGQALIVSTIRTEETYALFIKALSQSSGQLQFRVLKSAKMSQWIDTAGGQWQSFLNSSTPLFDPIVELVQITKR